ncbi:hypothetical protein AB832_07870 [Flavobacteriaceae bacterium (ex Bugula neritina AB1)]|nr:hypothetical protein AB832_07870 [Flavobacteriaceae bacterium (ex Bugula neritina AB1)]
MSELIEKTGYSYSGVCDVVRNSDDNETETYLLLTEVNKEYNLAKLKQERLEKELEVVKAKRGNMVNMFLHIHKAMNLSGDLVFQEKDNITVIKVLNENSIDYSKIELTDFSKLNK